MVPSVLGLHRVCQPAGDNWGDWYTNSQFAYPVEQGVQNWLAGTVSAMSAARHALDRVGCLNYFLPGSATLVCAWHADSPWLSRELDTTHPDLHLQSRWVRNIAPSIGLEQSRRRCLRRRISTPENHGYQLGKLIPSPRYGHIQLPTVPAKHEQLFLVCIKHLQGLQSEFLAHDIMQISDASHGASIHLVCFRYVAKDLLSHEPRSRVIYQQRRVMAPQQSLIQAGTIIATGWLKYDQKRLWSELKPSRYLRNCSNPLCELAKCIALAFFQRSSPCMKVLKAIPAATCSR